MIDLLVKSKEGNDIKKNIKVLMLDIDGVVCNRKCWSRKEAMKDGHHYFDDDCVKLLDEIINKTSAKIVISSTWRICLDLTKMKDIFNKRDFKYCENIIDFTPIKNDCSRGWEIREWLSTQKYKSNFIVKNYVIVDDDIDMLYEQRNNFVKTNTEIGLTRKDADKIIKILKK